MRNSKLVSMNWVCCAVSPVAAVSCANPSDGASASAAAAAIVFDSFISENLSLGNTRDQIASSLISPVRTLRACATSSTNTLPSPIFPVWAVFWMVETT